MSKDSGVSPVIPHVATKKNSSASTPLRGVSNLDSPTARLEVTDTGREIWAYDLPCIPLVVPQYSDFSRILSLFEIIKRHHIDTFDADTNTHQDKKVEAFDASDILAHKGFQFKANAANGGHSLATLPKPYEIGSSTIHETQFGYNTRTKDFEERRGTYNTASYLTWGATAYPEYQLHHQSPFREITRASEIYVIPTAARCNFIGCRFEVVKNVNDFRNRNKTELKILNFHPQQVHSRLVRCGNNVNPYTHETPTLEQDDGNGNFRRRAVNPQRSSIINLFELKYTTGGAHNAVDVTSRKFQYGTGF